MVAGEVTGPRNPTSAVIQSHWDQRRQALRSRQSASSEDTHEDGPTFRQVSSANRATPVLVPRERRDMSESTPGESLQRSMLKTFGRVFENGESPGASSE